MILWN